MDEHSCYHGDEALLGQQKLRKKQEVGKKKTENKNHTLIAIDISIVQLAEQM